MGTDPVHTPQEVAERYSVPLSTVYRWSSDGTVTSLKVGRHLRFRESDLREFEARAARPARSA
jgi:excisionase family DNA binding protein